MGNISKKNAGKNNAESTDNGKSVDVQKISNTVAYQKSLKACIDKADELNSKAKDIFDDADYLNSLGTDMQPRYKDMSNRYEALKRAVANPDKEEMAALKKAGVTIEQVEARFQQFEKQFEVMEKTRQAKKQIAKDLEAQNLDVKKAMPKNIAFSTLAVEINGQIKTLNLMAISGLVKDFVSILSPKKVTLLEILPQKLPSKLGNYQLYEYKVGNATYYVMDDATAIQNTFKNVDFSDLGFDANYRTNAQDSERKIAMFAKGIAESPELKKLHKNTNIDLKSLTIDTEMSPCNSCFNVINAFAEKYGKEKLTTNYGVNFKHKEMPKDDPNSKYLEVNKDITDFLIN